MRVLRLLPFLLLAACGQSGDLYLPPEQPTSVESAPPDDSTRGQAPAEPAPAEQPPAEEKPEGKK